MRFGFYNKQTGNEGEKIACDFLKKKGYKIVKRNFSASHGEIDIIASGKGTLVFVEVKTRSSEKFGTAAEAVTYNKRNHIISAAYEYITKNPTDMDIRFDIVEVYGVLDGGRLMVDNINHIENAFWEE